MYLMRRYNAENKELKKIIERNNRPIQFINHNKLIHTRSTRSYIKRLFNVITVLNKVLKYKSRVNILKFEGRNTRNMNSRILRNTILMWKIIYRTNSKNNRSTDKEI